MSYYYNYYAGYKLNGKIYPLGPYDAHGKLHSIVSKSRSYASDIHEMFSYVKNEEISDELRKEFEYTDWDNKKKIDVKYLPLEEMPEDNFVKTGYFLIDDVKAYESNNDYFEGFYDVLTPKIYAAKLQNELMFGKNQPKKDEEGNEYIEHNASDYMYYAYPDYESKEYESFLICQGINMLIKYSSLLTDVEYIVLETEG